MNRQDRLKQQLIRELVRENIDTAKGILPASRARRRPVSGWLLGALAATVALAFSGPIQSTANRTSMRRASVGILRPAAAPIPADDAALPAPAKVDPSLFQLSIRKIVIDPGHGGGDPGAITAGGLEEKAITLDIAQRLHTLLKDSPYAAVLTRARDESVSLERRVEIANAENADLFLSIHINSMPMREGVGIETFFLGGAPDPATDRFARAENAGSGYSLADFRSLLEGVYVGVRHAESRRFAEKLQAGLFGELHGVNAAVENRGVKTAPLVVLVGTRMPAILAEVSCISNDGEARRLATSEYRSALARALLAGIRAYADPPAAAVPAFARRADGAAAKGVS